MQDITPEEAKRMLDSGDGVIYLDVRSVPEFDQGHVPGACNIPLLHLAPDGQMKPNQGFPEVALKAIPKDAAIVVGCKAGPRSAQAAQIMEQLGYANVSNMLGGQCGKTTFTGEVIEPGWIGMGYALSTTPVPGNTYEELCARTC